MIVRDISHAFNFLHIFNRIPTLARHFWKSVDEVPSVPVR
jgi:hypothetical protein